MRRIARFAVAGALAVCVTGALALAAGTDQPRQARVADLAKVIASAKNLSVKQVSDFLAKKGFDPNTPLTERLAAEAFGALGLTNLSASQNRAVTESQVGTLGSLASLVDTRSLSLSGDRQDNQGVVNQASPKRRSPTQANSNANINAFESLNGDIQP